MRTRFRFSSNFRTRRRRWRRAKSKGMKAGEGLSGACSINPKTDFRIRRFHSAAEPQPDTEAFEHESTRIMFVLFASIRGWFSCVYGMLGKASRNPQRIRVTTDLNRKP